MKSWAEKLKILINEKELQSDITDYITDLKCETSIDKVDMIEFTILNPWNKDTGKPLFADRRELLPGNEIEVWYDGHLLGRGTLMRGVELYHAHDYPTLQRKAYSKEFFLTQRNFSESGGYLGKFRWSDYAKCIADAYGFGYAIDFWDRVLPINIKKDSNDWEILKAGARLNDYVFFLEAIPKEPKWILHFHKEWITPKEERKRLTWSHHEYSTLNWLEMDWQITDQRPEIKVIDFYDEYDQELLAKWAMPDELKQLAPEVVQSLDPVRKLFAFRGTAINASIGNWTTTIISNRKIANQEEALQYVKKWYKEQEDKLVIVRGETKGDPTIVRGSHNYIEGVGDLLTGLYYFFEVNHIFGEGYATEFRARKVLDAI